MLKSLVFITLISFCTTSFAIDFENYIDLDGMNYDIESLPAEMYEPQIEPFSAEQVFDAYGVDVVSEFPVVILVSKSSQTATVYNFGSIVNTFQISTGRERWETAKSGRQYLTTTPTGWYSPMRYVREHWSRTWDALMEYAIFFNGGVALHATTPEHFNELGTKASGGCVRMHPDNARWFWNLSLQDKTANVPYFTRGGQILKDEQGNIKRHQASGTLIIVTAN